jgi:hypothetical protein
MQESVPARSSRPVTLSATPLMSILDDAIREHLELIRRRGATDTEVQRLEDEAFGPPTRPDEADFPESEDGQASGNGAAADAAVEEPEDLGAHEDVTTLLQTEGAGEEPVELPGTGLEEPTGAHITGDVEEAEGEPVLGEPLEEPAVEDEHEEPVAEEHAIVEEEPAVEATEEEPPAPAEGATTLYDQGTGEDMDIDLDLTPEEEAAPEERPSEEHPVGQPEGAVPVERPIESLDTVEHPLPGEITESEELQEESAASDEHAVEEESTEAEAGEDAEGSEEGDEDVLADTPEFLKDQPEDDELWFEQGEPKDFDF